MKWSLQIGRIAGIKVFIHWTFLLLLGWIFFVYYESGNGLPSGLYGVVFVMALFGCVVLHELGHALTARRYGIQTRDITLLPIGGIARLERMPREPGQELLVALAGPAVNVVIAGLLFFALWVFGANTGGHPELLAGTFWGQLMITNIILALFNLVPAFPMDGGRILRALLARKLDYALATTLAARVGQVVAVGFAFLGLYLSPLLLLVAVFVFFGAEAEAQSVRITDLMKGSKVQEAMITRFRSLSAHDSLNVAVSELLTGTQQDFPVVEGDDVVGVLARNDLVKALVEKGPETPVGQAMHANSTLITENDELEYCYGMLRQNGCSTLPVVRQGRLIGMISLENITEWLMVHSALRQTPQPSHAPA